MFYTLNSRIRSVFLFCALFQIYINLATCQTPQWDTLRYIQEILSPISTNYPREHVVTRNKLLSYLKKHPVDLSQCTLPSVYDQNGMVDLLLKIRNIIPRECSLKERVSSLIVFNILRKYFDEQQHLDQFCARAVQCSVEMTDLLGNAMTTESGRRLYAPMSDFAKHPYPVRWPATIPLQKPDCFMPVITSTIVPFKRTFGERNRNDITTVSSNREDIKRRITGKLFQPGAPGTCYPEIQKFVESGEIYKLLPELLHIPTPAPKEFINLLVQRLIQINGYLPLKKEAMSIMMSYVDYEFGHPGQTVHPYLLCPPLNYINPSVCMNSGEVQVMTPPVLQPMYTEHIPELVPTIVQEVIPPPLPPPLMPPEIFVVPTPPPFIPVPPVREEITVIPPPPPPPPPVMYVTPPPPPPPPVMVIPPPPTPVVFIPPPPPTPPPEENREVLVHGVPPMREEILIIPESPPPIGAEVLVVPDHTPREMVVVPPPKAEEILVITEHPPPVPDVPVDITTIITPEIETPIITTVSNVPHTDELLTTPIYIPATEGENYAEFSPTVVPPIHLSAKDIVGMVVPPTNEQEQQLYNLFNEAINNPEMMETISEMNKTAYPSALIEIFKKKLKEKGANPVTLEAFQYYENQLRTKEATVLADDDGEEDKVYEAGLLALFPYPNGTIEESYYEVVKSFIYSDQFGMIIQEIAGKEFHDSYKFLFFIVKRLKELGYPEHIIKAFEYYLTKAEDQLRLLYGERIRKIIAMLPVPRDELENGYYYLVNHYLVSNDALLLLSDLKLAKHAKPKRLFSLMLRELMSQGANVDLIQAFQYYETIFKTKTITKTEIETVKKYSFETILTLLPAPQNSLEDTYYQTIKEFLVSPDVTIIIPAVSGNTFQHSSALLHQVVQILMANQKDPFLIEAFRYYSNLLMPADDVETEEIRKQFNLTSILLDAMEVESLPPEIREVFDRLFDFVLTVTPEQIIGFENWTEAKTKGEFTKLFFNFLLNSEFVPEAVRYDIITLDPFVHMTGFGALPI